MKTFYSILFVPIRPALMEQISIGLLLRDENNIYFNYSHEKLEACKRLLPTPAFSLLKTSIKNLESILKKDADKDFLNQDSFFPIISISDEKVFNASYISYLSKYNTNLITFSAPESIDIELNPENFARLFNKFIHTIEQAIPKKVSIQEVVKTSLTPKIEKRVNIDINLTSKEISGLLTPTRVFFAGKNEIHVLGEVIDFGQQPYHLSNNVNKVLGLSKSFELSKLPLKQYIIGDEPNKSQFAEQHTVWSNLRKTNLFDMVPPNESDQIADYMEDHNVKPVV